MIILPNHPLVKNYIPVPIEFQEDGHTYTLDGTMIPGTTTITGQLDKPWLAGWKVKMLAEYINKNLMDIKCKAGVIEAGKKVANTRRDAAADTGKQVHKWIEKYIQGETLPRPIDEGRIDRFLEWEKENKPIWIASEEIVVSRAHKYGGTLDALLGMRGRTFLGDIKTGGTIPDEAPLQLDGGYRIALKECGVEPDASGILHLPANGKAEWKEVEAPVELSQKAFLGLREAQKFHSWLENRKKGGK